MKKLYSLVQTNHKDKKKLYVKGTYQLAENGILHMKEGNLADFTTYFNSFSVKKWKRYTTIKKVTLELQGEGDFAIVFEQLLASGNIIKIPAMMKNGEFSYSFDVEKISGDILGFSIKCLSPVGSISSAAWYGEFEQWNEKKIGVSITTFKREEYVKRTIAVLQDFQKDHEWLDILVVDNGQTLVPEETEHFRIIPNRNFGGSGGFTRGMIEYVEQGKVDYVLLMDDDIVLEPSAIERTQSLLCGLKEDYRDSFLSGAMLSLEKPTMQYENTAHWGKIRLYGNGKAYDMTILDVLVKNEKILNQHNRYGAWWYCVIPSHRIKEIGYPLPVFVKGDDMEYGIRNHKELLHMNGIGVWHQSFQSKISAVVNYYSDRNMLIINNYADGCGQITFTVAVLGRLVKRLLQRKKIGLFCLYCALKDYNLTLEGITAIPSDEKMKNLMTLLQNPLPENLLGLLYREMGKAIREYSANHKKYMAFREQKLQDSQFWKVFMK